MDASSSSFFIEKLQGDSNYQQWKYDMENALGEKDLLAHTDGTSNMPEAVIVKNEAGAVVSTDDKEQRKWMALDRKAMGLIARSLSVTYHAMIRDCKSAKAIWDKIRSEFESASESSTTEAWAALLSLTFDSEKRAPTFIAEVNVACERLTTLKEQVSDGLKKGILMRSLPASFAVFRETYSGLQSAKALDELSFSQLCVMVKDAEVRITKSEQGTSGQSVALKSKVAVSCFECGGPHFKRDCPKLKSQTDSHRNSFQSKGTKQFRPKNSNRQSRKEDTAMKTETAGLFCLSAGTRDAGWVLDSGASAHMTRDKSLFSSYRILSSPTAVKIGDDQVVHAKGIGDISCELFDGSAWTRQILKDVLHIPGFGSTNLLSMCTLLDRGFGVQVDNEEVSVRKGGQVCAIGKRTKGRLFRMMIRTGLQDDALSSETGDSSDIIKEDSGISCNLSLQVWHERFAHASADKIKSMMGKDVVKGLQITDTQEFTCTGCILGKMCQQPFKSREKRICLPGQFLHCDLLQFELASFGGNRFSLVIVDEASGYKLVTFLKHKNQSSQKIMFFLKQAENETGRRCIRFRTDNGGEFVNEKLISYMEEQGIVFEKSAPRVHQQNGMAERANRTLAEHAACLIHQRSLPKALWAEAVRTVAISFNRMLNRKETEVTPHEQWKGVKPDVSKLRIFGCEAYGFIPPEQRRGKKLAPKSVKGVFVGYGETLTQYKLYFKSEHKFHIFRDVKFAEAVSSSCGIPDHPVDESESDPQPAAHEHEKEQEKKKRGRPAGAKNFSKFTSEATRQSDRLKKKTEEKGTDADGQEEEVFKDASESPFVDEQVVDKDADDLLKDFGFTCMADNREENDVPILHYAFTAFKEDQNEPLTYQQAVESENADQWTTAMESEMESLTENKTWTLVSLPPGRKVIKCKWVYKLKRKPDNTIIKAKARLVAKGFSQKEGVDFKETFAPVARYDSIRTVLSLVSALDFHMIQFDVRTAFLYGDLEEEIFMQQPEGFSDGSNKVCKLLKGLYGLKQASRQWNLKFSNFLLSHGLVKSKADPCIYTKNTKGIRTILCLYVDDGLVCSSSKEEMIRLIDDLKSTFEITTSDVSCFIGLEIERQKDSIRIHQKGYISRILNRFGMRECKPQSTPADPKCKLSSEMSAANDHEKEDMRIIPYREAIGSLLFAAIVSRPDIAFAVSKAAKFVQEPGPEHWKAVKRIFRYLKKTMDSCISYANGSCKVTGFTDADWGGQTDRRSTTGYLFKLNSGPIVWQSRSQSSIALSTLEAEYMAMSDATKECIWIRQLMQDLSCEQKTATVIRVDNQAAIKLSLNPEFHQRSKHIDIRFHFLRDEVNKGKVIFSYIATSEQPADLLTKGLCAPAFNNCVKRIGLSASLINLTDQ